MFFHSKSMCYMLNFLQTERFQIHLWGLTGCRGKQCFRIFRSPITSWFNENPQWLPCSLQTAVMKVPCCSGFKVFSKDLLSDQLPGYIVMSYIPCYFPPTCSPWAQSAFVSVIWHQLVDCWSSWCVWWTNLCWVVVEIKKETASYNKRCYIACCHTLKWFWVETWNFLRFRKV
jgi:hypothetical protein